MPLRGFQAQAALERPGGEIQRALEVEPLCFLQAQRRVAESQPEVLPLGDRHPRVGAAGEAGETLVVVDGVLLEHARQERAIAGAVVFLQRAAHAQRAVGEGEQGFIARRAFAVERPLGKPPGIGPAFARRALTRCMRLLLFHRHPRARLLPAVAGPRAGHARSRCYRCQVIDVKEAPQGPEPCQRRGRDIEKALLIQWLADNKPRIGAPACLPGGRCDAAAQCAQVVRTTRWVGSVSETAWSPSISARTLRASSTPASMKFWCTEVSGGT